MTFPTSEPIAIIGMGCRYPDASNLGEFWRNQCAGHQSFGPVDPRRWDHSRFFASGRDPDGTPCDRVAHLRNVEYFAASHFHIAPRRAEVMDPQQRLLLEVTWEALQDAGLKPEQYDRARSAAYVGCSLAEYLSLSTSRLRERQMLAGQFGTAHDTSPRTQRLASIRSYTLPGNMMSMNASVVTQYFDWGGPSLSLDGACASSLLSVHEACTYLQRQSPEGLAAVALAAGVYLNFVPDNLVAFSRIGALAYRPSSAFDSGANGFTLGEGIGAVLLKRLDQAQRDGDRIYAVIRGTHCNSDGAAPSPMTPQLSGQFRLLREGLEHSGVQAAELGYLECHGTATPVGDQVELQAWREVLGEAPVRPYIGSVKSNVGHTISAAGVAGLIRATLAVYHASIPPHAGWKEWHPNLKGLAPHFQVPDAPQPWNQEIRRASVSSFAFGGINCLAVLESVSAPAAPPARRLPLVVGAPNQDLLDGFCRQLLEWPAQPLNWAAYTLTVLRPAQTEQRLIWAESYSEFQDALRNWRDLPGPGQEDFTLHFAPQDRRVADLPPTPLQRKAYWVIAKEAQDQGNHHERAVREWLARNCGCAPNDFKPEQHLIDDLGLDSMALRDLITLLPPVEEGLENCANWTVGELLAQCRLPELLYSGGKLSPASHPFLLDHALDKTMLLPLASGLDFLAWSQNMQAPWSLYNVQVHRGLMFREQAEIALEREDRELRLMEVRSGGRKLTGMSAQMGELGQPPAPVEMESQWNLQGELQRFYDEVAFHGTRLQGISSLQKAGDAGLVGMVRTSIPRDWVPGDPRSRWHLDPLVIDSCLQLCLYWVHRQHGRPVLPHAIGEITLQTQLSPGLVEARVRALEVKEEGPAADVMLYQNGRLVGWIREVQSRWVQSLPPRSWQAIPSEWTKASLLPEVEVIQERLRQLGEHNPYFKVLPAQHLSFCQYNYVGLAHHPKVLEAASLAVAEHGCSAQASRLVGGEITLHRQLERELAQFLGHEDGLVMVGGHSTNTTLLSHWMQAPDLILHDSLSHNSILEGAQASKARRLSFPHNDTVALEAMLRKMRTRFRRVLLVVEGIYSMDGDIAPLPELLRIKQQYGCLLMVDEAHSLGVLGKTGRGICEHFGADPTEVDLLMGTLSKALGSCGGYLVGSKPLIDYLRYTLPGFVYSVGLSPPLAASARAALQLLIKEPHRVEALRQRSKQFWEGCQRQGLPLGTSQATPVIPIILGDSAACTRICAGLAQGGIQVKPIVYPAVEESAARLRFFLSSEHTPEQLEHALQALAELLGVGLMPHK
jgi:8-amino-7-oxononanoate synthase